MRQTILLYAVTGAGKTEMMFQGIQYARRQGDNIAIVSPRVDVVVIDAHQYTQEALIQIAGRVGRKLECPTGKVLFFHEGVSMNMIQAKKEIQKMNKLALKRGWIDE